MIHVISLGAGVQSSTMALMAAHGEITPMPDCAVFADTQAEPQSVYRWLDWLEKQLPFPVHRVTQGNLGTDSLAARTSKKSGNRYIKNLVPIWLKAADGSRSSTIRKCTRDYKITPIMRKLKELGGVCQFTVEPVISLWIGISSDEIIRMKPSQVLFARNRWPLVDMRLSRDDCFAWMGRHGYPRPPRSACVFCPYHSTAEWRRLKAEEPEDFAAAVLYEKQLTHLMSTHNDVLDGVPFLWDGLEPIENADFNHNPNQADMFGNECEGMCGV